MSANKMVVMEPRAGDFGESRMKRLFHATRPKLFPASVLPIIVGTAWGSVQSGSIDIVVAVLALVAIVLLHGAGHVLNDVGDETGGNDRRNMVRIYPYTGTSHFIQNRIMTTAEMARWGVQLLAAAALLGLVLIWLQTGTLDLPLLIFALPVSAWVAACILFTLWQS